MENSSSLEAQACEEFEADLVLLHYNDLAGAELVKLQNHLPSCTSCATYLNSLGKLLPLTQANDDPAEIFWQAYSREMRHKLDAIDRPSGWWARFGGFFQPRLVPSLAAAAMVVLALSFTIGNGLWNRRDEVKKDTLLIDALPVAENLDLFRNMELLDNIEMLEFMSAQENTAA